MAENPLKEDFFSDADAVDPARRVRSAATKIRNLRGQVGHDGLNPSAARTLIDELTKALDVLASSLEGKDGP